MTFNLNLVKGIDFERLAELAKNDPAGFEIARSQYLAAYIKAIEDLPQRNAAYAFSLDLDLKRFRLQRETGDDNAFTEYCCNQMKQMLDQMEIFKIALAINFVEIVAKPQKTQVRLPDNVVPFKRDSE